MGFRYIGTKTRIVDEILAKISEIVDTGARIVDLMCRIGAVPAALRKQGYRVTANDLMTYSYHHARVILLFTELPTFANAHEFINRFYLDEEKELFPLTPYERLLRALNNVPLEKGYFWKEFSVEGEPRNAQRPRNYFSPENAAKIDAFRGWIRELHNEKQINDLEHSLLIHDLIMASNDVANIAGTYGHYLSKLVGRAKEPIQIRPTPLFLMDDSGKHAVLQGYAEEIARQTKCDLCYIDPPYMKRQYAANYHILETLAREDEPEAIGASGLSPWRDQHAKFCTKTRIRESFRQIFINMGCHHYLISYSEDGLLSLEQLKELFEEFGETQMSTLRNKRFKSNKSDLRPYLTEYLFHVTLP